MLSLGKKIRLERIKHRPSGKVFFVTVDHSITRGVFAGLVNMKETLRKIVAGRPDGITMHKGIAQEFFYPYAGQVSLVLKASSFSPYQPTYDTWVAWVDEAVRLGADAISMGVLVGGDRQAEMLHNLGLISREASLAGMPLIAHIYPKGEMIKEEDQYSVKALSYAVRAGAELGVDIIKTWYPGSPDAFSKGGGGCARKGCGCRWSQDRDRETISRDDPRSHGCGGDWGSIWSKHLGTSKPHLDDQGVKGYYPWEQGSG